MDADFVGRHRLCGLSELPTTSGDAKSFAVRGIEVGVFNVEGRPVAVDSYCTHERSSLVDEGWVDGDVVECAWHGSRFSLLTGEALTPPACRPLNVYELTTEGDDVYVERDVRVAETRQ